MGSQSRLNVFMGANHLVPPHFFSLFFSPLSFLSPSPARHFAPILRLQLAREGHKGVRLIWRELKGKMARRRECFYPTPATPYPAISVHTACDTRVSGVRSPVSPHTILFREAAVFIVWEGVPFHKRASVRAKAQGSQRFLEALLSTVQALTLTVEVMALPPCAAARRIRGERSLW